MGSREGIWEGYPHPLCKMSGCFVTIFTMESKSGAVFVNEKDMERWEELEAEIIMNDKQFRIFTAPQWDFLLRKVVPLINKARKQL